jgi:hypothetical protein
VTAAELQALDAFFAARDDLHPHGRLSWWSLLEE